MCDEFGPTYRFERTCYACPEQYDVFNERDEQVAYFRLRHGTFSVECPDVGGVTVYKAHPEGDGIFLDEERTHYMNRAIMAVHKHYHSNENSEESK